MIVYIPHITYLYFFILELKVTAKGHSAFMAGLASLSHRSLGFLNGIGDVLAQPLTFF
jgi:hypothetical protein